MTFFKTKSKSDPDDFKATFQPGDLVRLKSGGPVMTVSLDCDSPGWLHVAVELGRPMGIYCSWFVDNRLHEGIFRAAQLVEEKPVQSVVERLAAYSGDRGMAYDPSTQPYDYDGN